MDASGDLEGNALDPADTLYCWIPETQAHIVISSLRDDEREIPCKNGPWYLIIANGLLVNRIPRPTDKSGPLYS
jgi:hypothetical protein